MALISVSPRNFEDLKLGDDAGRRTLNDETLTEWKLEAGRVAFIGRAFGGRFHRVGWNLPGVTHLQGGIPG